METAVHILLIDNSIAIRSGLKALLKPLNAEIIEASNGMDGLDLVSKGSFNAIITSIDLPKMNGLEFCRQVRQNAATQAIPIIVLSAFDSADDVDRAIQAGASAYVEKREARTRLYETLQKLLTKTSTAQPERTILIVEDSRSIRTMLQKGLMEAGFRVLTAGNGKEALEVLTQEYPDLILSDINMPEMDGVQLCEMLRSYPEFATIPFVVMSTISDREQMRRLISYGATDYMVKPFSIDEMIIHIERFLKDRLLLLLKDKERLDAEREMLLGSINSLLAVLEARDLRLREHSETVARIAAGMATLAGATKKELELVTLGAKLHDIGKVALRDEFLFHPDLLDHEGRQYLTQHPRIGATILQRLPHLPPEILAIVLSHHERPDGKGYPKGLHVDQIPKWAGITAVANAYDRLTGKAPYGKEVPVAQAVQLLEAMSDAELCSEYVYLFQEWFASKYPSSHA